MRNNRMLLPAVAFSLPDPVVGVDGDGVVRAWNAAAVATFGASEQEAHGRRAHELIGVDVLAPSGSMQRLRTSTGTIEAAVDIVAVGAGSGSSDQLAAMLVVRPRDEVLTSDALPPRLRQTLDGLCEGLAKKEIAARLGLSPHTIHDYVRELYRRFRVQSRAGLVARILVEREHKRGRRGS